MYSVSGLSVTLSKKEIFNKVSFVINPKDRVGLIGKNGSGKTTLLNLFANLSKPDEGQISIPSDKVVGYLPQELVKANDDTVYNEVLKAFDELNRMEKEIEALNHKLANLTPDEHHKHEQILHDLQHRYDRFEYLDGNKKLYLTEQVLKGLGFDEKDFSRKVNEFSAGWQMRVELAKILLQKPDLLLLDEPTNHLDIESIIWLEEYLKAFNGAVIVVSHDKMFLNNVTTRTIEIVHGRIYDYKAPYDKFLILRKELFESQLATAKNQQKHIEQQEKFINKFRYKATKSRQVQSKIKLLDKIERVEFDEFDYGSIHFKFPPAPRSGAVVLETKNASKKYDHKQVLKSLEFTIEKGERIAFVGRNGEGKTTLVKMIMGNVPFEGELKIGYNISIGYYAQVQEQELSRDSTVYDEISMEATGDWQHESKLRTLLGAFLFSEEDIGKKVRVLSGGEKSRLALAKLLLKPVNLLILDEPTNHLDISAKEVLKDALLNFDGTLILVSHDRSFLEGLTTKTFEFKNKGIKEHLGGIDEFLAKHKVDSFRDFELKPAAKQTMSRKDQSDSNIKENYALKKEFEREIKRIKNSISKTEDLISKVEKDIAATEHLMQSADFYNSTDYAREVSQKYDNLQKQLKLELNNWEVLHNQLEAKEKVL
jgi:ATP-binding cassette subfamily F protein 3